MIFPFSPKEVGSNGKQAPLRLHQDKSFPVQTRGPSPACCCWPCLLTAHGSSWGPERALISAVPCSAALPQILGEQVSGASQRTDIFFAAGDPGADPHQPEDISHPCVSAQGMPRWLPIAEQLLSPQRSVCSSLPRPPCSGLSVRNLFVGSHAEPGVAAAHALPYRHIPFLLHAAPSPICKGLFRWNYHCSKQSETGLHLQAAAHTGLHSHHHPAVQTTQCRGVIPGAHCCVKHCQGPAQQQGLV